MRKFMLLGAVVALVVAALAIPALAQQRGFGNDNERWDNSQWNQRDNSWWDSNNDRNNWWDHTWWNDGRNNGTPAVSQSNEQEIQSGDAEQNISVRGGGGNSNQCVGVQGVNNTGNATTNTSVLQYANDGAGVEVQDSGNFTISPSQTVSCDQQVNQAASASGR